MSAINSGQNTAAAWEAYVGTEPADNWSARHFLYEQLRANGSFEKQNGVVIRHNLEYASNPNVKFMSELETMTVSRPDTFDNAEFSWKFVGGDVPMTDFERGITSGGAAKFDLEARKLENLKMTIEEKTNTSFFSDGTGTGNKEFGGLQLLVSTTPTSGTVGLINRASFPFYRNQQVTGTKTTNAFDNLLSSMETAYNSASNGPGSQNPTFAVGTQAAFEGFNSVTVTIERIVRDGPNDKLQRGFKSQNVLFKDIPFGYDAACPSGNVYILNNRNLYFIYMQWMKGEAAVRPADAFFDVFKVLTIGNMTTDNPRRLAVVSAVN